MRHRDATHADRQEVAVQDMLFKPDRPRTIDRYIDFFGGMAADDDPARRYERTTADEHSR
jgi:hypothetical protein